MRAIANRHCLVCGEPYVQLWTLDNLKQAGAMYLCRIHGGPLQELLELAGDTAPEDQVPVPLRGKDFNGGKQPKLVPLLDWTPPEESTAS